MAQVLLLAGTAGVLLFGVLLVYVRATENVPAALFALAVVALASGGLLYLLSSARPKL